MKYRMWISVLAGGIAALSLSAAAAQAPKAATQTKAGAKPATAAKAWAPPHTPWGDPDLQGVWNDATSTPLQRPTGVKEKDVLSDGAVRQLKCVLDPTAVDARKVGADSIDGDFLAGNARRGPGVGPRFDERFGSRQQIRHFRGLRFEAVGTESQRLLERRMAGAGVSRCVEGKQSSAMQPALIARRGIAAQL